jgi:hypothetical protein
MKRTTSTLLALWITSCTVHMSGDPSSSPPATVSAGGQGPSAQVAGAGGHGGSGGACAIPRFFDEVDFQNHSIELGPGRYDVAQLEQTPLSHDSIMSVCVPPGWHVTLFMDGGFSGDRVDLSSSVRDLGAHNRSTSSIIVTAP